MENIDDINVADAMTRGVICVDSEDTVESAAQVMKKNDISGVIVTKDGEGVGVVTERDIICKVVAGGKDPEKMISSDVMTSPLITIEPTASIDEAARTMRNKDIRRLVVSENGKIIGLLSEFDIVRIEPALHLLIKEKTNWDISKAHAAQSGDIAGICESCENYSDGLKNVDGRLLCDECYPQ